MSIPEAITIGIGGNEISKQITGTSEVSAGRTVVATAAGGAGGAVVAGAITVGAAALGVAAAPVVIPLAVASAAVSFFASLFGR